MIDPVWATSRAIALSRGRVSATGLALVAIGLDDPATDRAWAIGLDDPATDRVSAIGLDDLATDL